MWLVHSCRWHVDISPLLLVPCRDGARESFYSCLRILQQFASKSRLNVNLNNTKAVCLWSRINSRLRLIPECYRYRNTITFNLLGVDLFLYRCTQNIVTITFLKVKRKCYSYSSLSSTHSITALQRVVSACCVISVFPLSSELLHGLEDL